MPDIYPCTTDPTFLITKSPVALNCILMALCQRVQKWEMRPLAISITTRRTSSCVFIRSDPKIVVLAGGLAHMCYRFSMSKQVSAEGRFQLVQAVYSAVNHSDKRKRKTVTQACKDLGLARSTYNRWKKSLDENPEWIKDGVVPTQSRSPKRNGMSLPASVRHRMEDMARSGLYANPSQIGKALRAEGISVSDNAVRDNLERAGLYGYLTVIGSDGKPIKKKVILR